MCSMSTRIYILYQGESINGGIGNFFSFAVSMWPILYLQNVQKIVVGLLPSRLMNAPCSVHNNKTAEICDILFKIMTESEAGIVIEYIWTFLEFLAAAVVCLTH